MILYKHLFDHIWSTVHQSEITIIIKTSTHMLLLEILCENTWVVIVKFLLSIPQNFYPLELNPLCSNISALILIVYYCNMFLYRLLTSTRRVVVGMTRQIPGIQSGVMTMMVQRNHQGQGEHIEHNHCQNYSLFPVTAQTVSRDHTLDGMLLNKIFTHKSTIP